jgi:predicted RNA-binding Zn-ribbon protein involved in translation (DUF1610 family)
MALLASCTRCGCPISVWATAMQLQCPACNCLNVAVAGKLTSGQGR